MDGMTALSEECDTLDGVNKVALDHLSSPTKPPSSSVSNPRQRISENENVLPIICPVILRGLSDARSYEGFTLSITGKF